MKLYNACQSLYLLVEDVQKKTIKTVNITSHSRYVDSNPIFEKRPPGVQLAAIINLPFQKQTFLNETISKCQSLIDF